MAKLLKCYQNRPDCFSVTDDGKCMLLESYVRNGVHRPGNKFHDGCPFAKGILEAGGTYPYLCDKYPLEKDPEDRK